MLPDIQNEVDARGIDIDAVGIDGVRYPTTFSDGEIMQSGVATFSIQVGLPAQRRGTHMSRLVEVIHEHLQVLDPRELPIALKAVAARLDASGVQMSAAMPFALPVTAPESGLTSWQAYDLMICGRMYQSEFEVESQVTAEVTTLCPCSRAVSDYGAHNQRSRITLAVVGDSADPYPLPVARAIDHIRSVGSCPVYPLVKREDERHITMRAFDNSAFVEDVVRDLSLACREPGLRHRIRVRNLESIHGHDAIAEVKWAPSIV